MLSLRLLELLIEISFKFDERFEYFFVLFRVFVPEQYRLLCLFLCHISEVIEHGIRVLFPEVLEFGYLLRRYLARPLKVCAARLAH